MESHNSPGRPSCLRRVPQSVGVQTEAHNFKVETLDAVHDMAFRVVHKGIYLDAVKV